MEIRSARQEDLKQVPEIDATIHATHYLHVEQSGEALAIQWTVQERTMRSPLIVSNPLSDEAAHLLRQIISGADEGLALVAEHDHQPVALLLAQTQAEVGILRLIDLRIDFDHRRQGLATAMLFMAISHGREQKLRAVQAETRISNSPAAHLLAKCGFDLCGLDTRRHSNHDLVKESATVFWYAALE